MPTYSYACTECDHRFDAVQAFTEDALTNCPQCSGRLRKLFNSVGVVFKGSGFYRTDSRESGGGKTGNASGAKSDSTGGDQSSEKSAKPEKAPDSASSTGSTASKSSAPAAASS